MDTRRHYKTGELLLVGKTTYKAIPAIQLGDCTGCDLKFRNGKISECHAPENIGCTGVVFKKYTPPNDIDSPYRLDDIDFKGCRNSIIIIASAIGAALAAIGTAIYYSIII